MYMIQLEYVDEYCERTIDATRTLFTNDAEVALDFLENMKYEEYYDKWDCPSGVYIFKVANPKDLNVYTLEDTLNQTSDGARASSEDDHYLVAETNLAYKRWPRKY